MKALVIGSEGCIGIPLVRYLRDCGHEVRTADIEPRYRPDFLMADINSPLDLLPAFDWGPEVVYLLAAVVSRVTSEQAASLAVATNLGGTNNVAQLCKRAGARLVYFSTSEVYGPTDGLMYELATCHPNNRYGLTKYLAEQLIAYEVQHGLDAVIVRPFMVYSENEEEGDHRSAFIRFASSLVAGRPVIVHDGTARSWLHVEDAVRAFERIGRQIVLAGSIVNVGHPEWIGTLELARRICRELGADPDLIQIEPQPRGMTPYKLPALKRQQDWLGFEPRIGIDEGIRRVCARYQAGRVAV